MPPPQHNLQAAADKALDALRSQSPEQFAWLGAVGADTTWRLDVLAESLEVDIASGSVSAVAGGVGVSAKWRILILHYLAVNARPANCPPEITFADLPAARAYAGVYQQRVIGRLCATAGRDLATLRAAAGTIGGRAVEGGDAAFDFSLMPRIRLRLIWHGRDEEFPPSATLLLPANIESFFCIEDIVVLSESLVSRLSGRPFQDKTS